MRYLALLLVCLIGVKAAAEPPVVILESTIVGNQEQPKVLYLVPWKAPHMPDQIFQPLQTQISDIYRPLEREEFLRELAFRERFISADENSQ